MNAAYRLPFHRNASLAIEVLLYSRDIAHVARFSSAQLQQMSATRVRAEHGLLRKSSAIQEPHHGIK